MDQQTLISRVTDALRSDDRVRALFLSGSFGRGSADEFSDVDFLAIVGKEQQEAFAADWRGILGGIVDVVYWNRLPWALVINAVDAAWLRIDLQVSAPSELRSTQDRLKPLIDRDGLYASLPAAAPAYTPDARALAGLVNEFIRVLGLLSVVLGRREYELGTIGTGMLRRMLSDLMIAEHQGNPGGILHLSRVITHADMATLLGLPVAEPNPHSIITANLALAHEFFPRAKALAQLINLEWPTAFEEAARRAIARAVPPQYAVEW